MIASHGLWGKTAPAAPASAPLTSDLRVEVAVVGGGYTGLSAALHLAEAGRAVAVLDAEDIGYGGSGRNVGLVNAGLWLLPDTLPQTLGETHGRRLLDCLGNGPHEVFALIDRLSIPCEARPVGTLHCAVGAAGLKELEQRAEQWQRWGAPVHLLSAEDAARRIGTTAYSGALLDERAGTIQPLAYARGLARAAQAAGALLHTRSAVTGWRQDGDGWRLDTAGGGVVRADWVVVATNAYTTTPWRDIRAEIVHLPYFNFATEPLSPTQRALILPGEEGCWDTREVLTSFRMDAAGRLVLGSVGALEGSGKAVHAAWARRTLRRLFPALDGVAFESAWYGKIGLTRDNIPRFHRFAPRVVAFCGYNGRGISPGTVFGRLLAELILGRVGEEDLPLPRSEPQAQSFRAVKEASYVWGSQLVHGLGLA